MMQLRNTFMQAFSKCMTGLIYTFILCNNKKDTVAIDRLKQTFVDITQSTTTKMPIRTDPPNNL